ncbi:MAG: AbrB family transcriptional regulator [Rickettsiaceae bacterium]|nr:MAG: AbrB family transcriptional regulator [Rickettsiaceae bacterium]
MSTEYKLTIGENGRIFLPIKIRETMKLVPGDQIILKLDEELKITPLRNTIRAIQAFIKSKNPSQLSLVDSLIETRHAEINNE